MKDVEEAQQKIVNIIRKLEDSAEIVISRGGGDEIVVSMAAAYWKSGWVKVIQPTQGL